MKKYFIFVFCIIIIGLIFISIPFLQNTYIEAHSKLFENMSYHNMHYLKRDEDDLLTLYQYNFQNREVSQIYKHDSQINGNILDFNIIEDSIYIIAHNDTLEKPSWWIARMDLNGQGFQWLEAEKEKYGLQTMSSNVIRNLDAAAYSDKAGLFYKEKLIVPYDTSKEDEKFGGFITPIAFTPDNKYLIYRKSNYKSGGLNLLIGVVTSEFSTATYIIDLDTNEKDIFEINNIRKLVFGE